MITRAQAEALLTLAESLEACERQGLCLRVPMAASPLLVHYAEGGFSILLGDFGEIQPMMLRYRIAEEVHHSET